MEEHKFGYKPDFEEGYAILRVFDTDENRTNNEENIYRLPIFISETTNQNPDKLLQLAGKLQTYYIRYLLIQVFNICEPDLVEIENKPSNIKQKENNKQKDMDFKKILSFKNFVINQLKDENKEVSYKNYCIIVDELVEIGSWTKTDGINLKQAYDYYCFIL